MRFKIKMVDKKGQLFTFPLKDEGYGVGVIVHADRRKAIAVQVFSVRLRSRSEINHMTFDPKDCLLFKNCSSMGFEFGTWEFHGEIPGWNPTDWPKPVFFHLHQGYGRYPDYYSKRTYLPDNLDGLVSEERISEEEAKVLPKDGVSGSEAIEIFATKKLQEKNL